MYKLKKKRLTHLDLLSLKASNHLLKNNSITLTPSLPTYLLSPNLATTQNAGTLLGTPKFPQSSLESMNLMKSYHREISLETFPYVLFPPPNELQ